NRADSGGNSGLRKFSALRKFPPAGPFQGRQAASSPAKDGTLLGRPAGIARALGVASPDFAIWAGPRRFRLCLLLASAGDSNWTLAGGAVLLCSGACARRRAWPQHDHRLDPG